MVMRIHESSQVQQLRPRVCRVGPRSHVGQDPLPTFQEIHGRVRKNRSSAPSLPQKRVEDETCSIMIDVHLLTGNLDEDISILNIVA